MKTMTTHRIRRLMVILIGFLMVASALVALFESQRTVPETAQVLSNPLASTLNNVIVSSPVNLQDPLTSADVYQVLANQNVPSTYVYMPNLNTLSSSSSTVQPLYTRSPAPMGLADYGFTASSGSNYAYDTTSFYGSFMTEGLTPYYPMNGAPDKVSVQMNTVLNGVTVMGNSNNVYWAQNVVLFQPSTGTMEFVDNIWNFSSPSMYMPDSTIYSGNGQVVSNMFYYAVGPTVTASGTYTLELYTTSTVIDGRNAIQFSYAIAGTSSEQTVDRTVYDTVIFNSTAAGSTTPVNQAYFHVDGNKKTPSGMLYDAEIVIGGPGSGSNTVIYAANDQFKLKYESGGSYVAIPAAYNFGSNAGETVEGLSSWFISTKNPICHLSLGPSILVPLWGSTVSHSGAFNLLGNISPSNAFVFMNAGTSFNNATAAWAPINPNGTFQFALPGGLDYSAAVLMSEYEPVYYGSSIFGVVEETSDTEDGGPSNDTGGGPSNVTSNETAIYLNVTLSFDPSKGIYTPLYAVDDAQVANLTVGLSLDPNVATPVGDGSSTSPYMIENNQVSAFNNLFLLANHQMYPTFFGILLKGTTAYASIEDPPSFQFQYPSSMSTTLKVLNVPVLNNFNMVFDHTVGVSVVGGHDITGWFGEQLYGTGAANVMFLDSTDFLVANNTFNSMGSSVFIYNDQGLNGQGTVFGNHFLWHYVTMSTFRNSLMYGTSPYGLQIFSSGNLIYNNYFDTAVPVYCPAFDIFTGSEASYVNAWNLPSIMPASHSETVNGHILTGNLTNIGYQGGNYWSEYDGTIPYTSDGAIVLSGDYLPLVPPSYPLTFTAQNLPLGTSWGVIINNNTQMTTGSSITFQLPNGTYLFSVIAPSNYNPSPKMGYIGVYAQAQTVNIDFTHVVYAVNVKMSGLPTGMQWGIDVAGEHYYSSESSMSVYCDNGTYNYSVFAPDYYSGTPSSGSFLIFGSSVDLNINFGLTTYAVTFSNIGLPVGTIWTVTFDGVTVNSTGSSISFAVSNGNYSYSIETVDGYSISPASGYVLVSNESQALNVEFEEHPDNWRIAGLLAAGIAVGAAGSFVGIYIFRHRP